MDIKIVSVYGSDRQHHCVPIDTLYQLLYERESYEAISHAGMPSYKEHEEFISRRPYKNWWIIYSDLGAGMVAVGSIYLTYSNEIGIAVFKKYRRKGYARNAIEILMRTTNEPFYMANINPANAKSIDLFTSFGFIHIQSTLKLIHLPQTEEGKTNAVS